MPAGRAAEREERGQGGAGEGERAHPASRDEPAHNATRASAERREGRCQRQRPNPREDTSERKKGAFRTNFRRL